MKFWTFKDSPALSTFSEGQVERLVRMGKAIESVISIDVITFESIIKDYCSDRSPDFLTIDVEGSDYEILKTIDFGRYRPKLICVEINTHDRLLRSLDIEFLLFRNNYFHFGDVGGGLEGRNSLFVDFCLFEKVSSIKSFA